MDATRHAFKVSLQTRSVAGPRIRERGKLGDIEEIRSGHRVVHRRFLGRQARGIDAQVHMAGGVIIWIICERAGETVERSVERENAELIGAELHLAGGGGELDVARGAPGGPGQ